MENRMEIRTQHPVAIPRCSRIKFPPRRPLWASPEALLPLALILFATCSVALAQQAIKTGPEVGSVVPAFEAADQNGKLQNLKRILGPKGAMLVFYRSADW